ncbi:hypothetical protein BLA29_010848, partial [Euroglyphus maynei]
MSRSTIDRIRRLENDIFALRNTTEKQFDSSKLPIHNNSDTSYVAPIGNRIRKKSDKIDKSQNTDIDMEFMNKLLKYWQTNVRCPIDSIANGQQPQRRLKDPSRRLTTTISRSVKIQTDSDGKRFEEKGVTTDDLLQPIIERPMVAKTINTFHVCSDNKDNILIDLDPLPSQQTKPQTSPLPIVEMYSDTDD